MAELHQDEEVEEETQETTPQPESETEEASELDSLLAELDEDDAKEEKTKEDFLSEFNTKFGTTYNSEDEMKKGIKELRKKASEPSATAKEEPKAKAKATPKASTPDLSDDILEMRFPESKAVMAELESQSNETGKSKLEIYKSSTFMQNEAKARGQKESNTQKVNTPSQVKAETDYSNITEEDIMKLPPDKRGAALREMAKHGL